MVAQFTSEWVGGTPGNEHAWEEPRNWKPQCVPGIFHDVQIKHQENGHHAYPILKTQVTIRSLSIFGTIRLDISENASLTIEHDLDENMGLQNFGGTILNRDNIIIRMGPKQAILASVPESSPKYPEVKGELTRNLD